MRKKIPELSKSNIACKSNANEVKPIYVRKTLRQAK